MQTTKSFIRKRLKALYPAEEIESFVKLILENCLNISRTDLVMMHDVQITAAKLIEIEQIVNRLAEYEPIQYILGKTNFFGYDFKVSPDVLIPRPETEELVEWILKEHFPGQSLLDIGTGSGCIPVSLTREGHFSDVEAFDISDRALTIATENAKSNDVKIRFSKVDILRWDNYFFDRDWDIIVSNPPYVTFSEKDLMLKNVVDYEPHLALFVNNDDPLLFYRVIAQFANQYLVPGGLLFFEINEQYGTEVSRLLDELGYSSVVIRKDLSGKDRMIKAVKNSL